MTVQAHASAEISFSHSKPHVISYDPEKKPFDRTPPQCSRSHQVQLTYLFEARPWWCKDGRADDRSVFASHGDLFALQESWNPTAKKVSLYNIYLGLEPE